jgi:hypothetical protein
MVIPSMREYLPGSRVQVPMPAHRKIADRRLIRPQVAVAVATGGLV